MDIKEIIESSKIITPAQIIDLNRIDKNIEVIKEIRKETNCKFNYTLKGFSNNIILKHFIKNFDGISTSGIFETKLAKEFEKKVSVFSPAYTENDVKEICERVDYIIFNSNNQYEKFNKIAKKSNCSIGIRINPGDTEICNNFSVNYCLESFHLGITKKDMPQYDEFGNNKLEGLHIHIMCEQGADSLAKMIDNLILNYDEYLKKIKWINLGGGQLFGKEDYDIEKAISSINKLKNKYKCEVIFEPCEGIMHKSGYYVTTVIDKIGANIIVDGSAVCHMEDTAYNGWKRDILGENITDKNNYKIIGCSCYSKDSFGNYNFKNELQIKDKIIFEDTASYTIVKSNMFNGIKKPNLYIIDSNYNIALIKEYDYSVFKTIL